MHLLKMQEIFKCIPPAYNNNDNNKNIGYLTSVTVREKRVVSNVFA